MPAPASKRWNGGARWAVLGRRAEANLPPGRECATEWCRLPAESSRTLREGEVRLRVDGHDGGRAYSCCSGSCASYLLALIDVRAAA